MAVAELADRFQVSWLVSICEREMVKWVEIPLIDRLLFADLHGLKELKVVYYISRSEKQRKNAHLLK